MSVRKVKIGLAGAGSFADLWYLPIGKTSGVANFRTVPSSGWCCTVCHDFYFCAITALGRDRVFYTCTCYCVISFF